MIVYVTWFPDGGRGEQNRIINMDAVPAKGDSFSLGDDETPIMTVRHVRWAPHAHGKNTKWHPEISLGAR